MICFILKKRITMKNYEDFIRTITEYLNEKYPGITLITDIFEHSFLLYLGCQFVPERCQFNSLEDNTNSFGIHLTAPVGVDIKAFIQQLIDLVSKFPELKVEPLCVKKIDLVRLIVPYKFVTSHWEGIKESINSIISKNDVFYRNWCAILKKNKLEENKLEKNEDVSLSKDSIEKSVRDLLLDFPCFSIQKIWGYLLQYHFELQDLKTPDVTFRSEDITFHSEFEKYPNVEFKYQDDGKKSISMRRDQLFTLLNEERELLKEFIAHKIDPNQPRILPPNSQAFLKEKIHRCFSITEEGKFRIELGYFFSNFEESAFFKRYGIAWTQGKRLDDNYERARYYEFDSENYVKVVLALIEEIKKKACIEKDLNDNLENLNLVPKEIVMSENVQNQQGFFGSRDYLDGTIPDSSHSNPAP
jgi:hypothetical protein